MSYQSFINSDGDTYGSFETFYIAWPGLTVDGDDYAPQGKGWYWQACFPGCIPDGEPSGPFDSEQAAIDDANDS